MNVIGTHFVAEQVFAELFCHTLGEGCDKDALVTLHTLLYFLHKVVDLILGGTHLDDWIEQSCGTNHLFDNNAFCLLQLIFGGCGTHIDGLRGKCFELIEAEGTVVECCGQTIAIFHKGGLSLAVASVHGTNLRHTLMTFVDNEEEVLWKEVEQAVRAFAWFASVEVARIVFDARAMSEFANHFKVVRDTRLEEVLLGIVSQLFVKFKSSMKVVLNLSDGFELSLLGCHEEVGRIDLVFGHGANGEVGESIDFLYGVDFSPGKVDTDYLLVVC